MVNHHFVATCLYLFNTKHMQIFKFGGASVKDAEGVKNVAEVLKQFSNQKICVVISAMGKTTNALEKLANAYFYKTDNAELILEEIKSIIQTHPIVHKLPKVRRSILLLFFIRAIFLISQVIIAIIGTAINNTSVPQAKTFCHVPFNI